MGRRGLHEEASQKDVEKGDEITVNYRDFVKFNFGSRQFRRETLLEKMAFLCQCADCSLEGEELEINERLRSEIRFREAESRRLTKSLSPRNIKTAVRLSEEIVTRVKKLDLRLEFASMLLSAFEGAFSTGMDAKASAYKSEALEYSQKFGDEEMYIFNEVVSRHI